MDIDKKDLVMKPLNWIISKQRDLEQNFKLSDTVLLISFSYTKNFIIGQETRKKTKNIPCSRKIGIGLYCCYIYFFNNKEGHT